MSSIMDSNLEEAATILGIPRWKSFTKVTIPLLKPAILSTILLVFSSAMSSYSVAVTLGNPVNYYVLATRMQAMLSGSGRNAGQGYVMPLPGTVDPEVAAKAKLVPTQ